MVEFSAAALQTAGIGAFFRPRDVDSLGVSYRQLRRLVVDGRRRGPRRGPVSAGRDRADGTGDRRHGSCCRASRGHLLMTALRVHAIGTESPHEVWIGIDRKARRPARTPAQVRVVRFSKAMLTYGVVRRPMLGVPVSITTPARTVVDCFRYRNKFGLDTALEALRDACASGSPRWTRSCGPPASAGRARSWNPTSKRFCRDDTSAPGFESTASALECRQLQIVACN